LGGLDASVLGGRPGNPYALASGPRPRPANVHDDDVEHYVECFDADAQHAAIQYYRYAMPLHRIVADSAAPGGERYQSLSELDIASMWLHPDGYDAHPWRHEFHDIAPEDRQKRYTNPALVVYSNQFVPRFPQHADGRAPSGDPFADQYSRYFPDLRARHADCGHYIPEEQPELLNEVLLDFLAN
jgi:pimeloyl-ACP methyl ester carboxylesterase